MNNFLQQKFGRLLLTCAILACAFVATAAQQFPPIDIADDFVAIGKLAANRKAPIMLVFTRPECPYCSRAKKEHLEPLRVSQNYGAKIIMREIVAADSRTVLRDFDGEVVGLVADERVRQLEGGEDGGKLTGREFHVNDGTHDLLHDAVREFHRGS